MLGLAASSAWRLDLDRGPNWLFVRPAPCRDGCDAQELAQRLEALLDQHFTNRLVLELDQVDLLTSLLLGQIVQLEEHIRRHGGLMRLCGLSRNNQSVLRATHLADRFPHFADRVEAVRGYRPCKPR